MTIVDPSAVKELMKIKGDALDAAWSVRSYRERKAGEEQDTLLKQAEELRQRARELDTQAQSEEVRERRTKANREASDEFVEAQEAAEAVYNAGLEALLNASPPPQP